MSTLYFDRELNQNSASDFKYEHVRIWLPSLFKKQTVLGIIRPSFLFVFPPPVVFYRTKCLLSLHLGTDLDVILFITHQQSLTRVSKKFVFYKMLSFVRQFLLCDAAAEVFCNCLSHKSKEGRGIYRGERIHHIILFKGEDILDS